MTARKTADGLMDVHAPMPIASTNHGLTMQRRDAFRDAIEAALTDAYRRGEESRPKVKPLEWTKPIGADTLTRAETIVGTYHVWTHPEAGGRWFATLRGAGNYLSHEASDEASCHAAAQADYDARILSALDLPPRSPNEQETER